MVQDRRLFTNIGIRPIDCDVNINIMYCMDVICPAMFRLEFLKAERHNEDAAHRIHWHKVGKVFFSGQLTIKIQLICRDRIAGRQAI